MTHAAIFDLDGTLVDSIADLACAVNLTRASYAMKALPVETIRPMVGNGVAKLLERALAGARFDLDEAILRQRSHYGAHLTDRTVAYPGVEAGLHMLAAAGWKLAVFTNKPREATEKILCKLCLDGFFSAIVAGGDAFALKPAPDGIFFLLDELKVAAKQTWMVGDHYTDLAAGTAAGTMRCFAQWGIGTAGQEAFDYAAKDFSDFVAHVLSCGLSK